MTSIEILVRTMKSLNCGVVGFIGEFNNLEFKKNDAEVEKIFTVARGLTGASLSFCGSSNTLVRTRTSSGSTSSSITTSG